MMRQFKDVFGAVLPPDYIAGREDRCDHCDAKVVFCTNHLTWYECGRVTSAIAEGFGFPCDSQVQKTRCVADTGRRPRSFSDYMRSKEHE